MKMMHKLTGCLLACLMPMAVQAQTPMKVRETKNLITLTKVGEYTANRPQNIQSATAIGGTVYLFFNHGTEQTFLPSDLHNACSQTELAWDKEDNLHANCVQYHIHKKDTLFYVAGKLRRLNVYVYKKNGDRLDSINRIYQSDKYYPQSITVDGKGRHLYTMAYTIDQSETENQVHFRAYTYQNRLKLLKQKGKDYTLPYIPAIQDSFCKGKFLYACYGLPSTDKGIYVIDTQKHVATHYSLNGLLKEDEEPEGFFVIDNAIYLITYKGVLYKVNGL